MKLVSLGFCVLFSFCSAKIYSKCEFANIAKQNGLNSLGTWTCIASHESNFDTQAINHDSGDYGILQISSLYWCGPGKACGISCDALLNDDITDDIKCAGQIFADAERRGNNGFSPWTTYNTYCQGDQSPWIAGCNV